MQLVYTSDLHGNLDLYQAAGEAALRRRANALVFGGDLCPGTPSAAATHLTHAQPEFLLQRLAPLLERWKQALPTLRMFAIPGNDDCQTILPVLAELEAGGLLENLHQSAKSLGPYTLCGLAFVPPTPFSIKDFERWDWAGESLGEPQIARPVLSTSHGFETVPDFIRYLNSLPTLEEELDRLPINEPVRTVLVAHSPPHLTRCDVLFDGRHIGSKALRRWIERRQPLLSLHGHIHESPRISGAFADCLGATTVINPGCDHTRPHLVFIDLENRSEIEHSIYGTRRLS